MINAGLDTVATVIRVSLLNIMNNPPVYARLKREIFSAIREGRVSNPITSAEAKAIPYLQALIYESLRMRSPTPGLFAKAVTPEGDYIGGMFIPGGTGVGVNSSAILASKTVFGQDADIFRPERFLETDAAPRELMGTSGRAHIWVRPLDVYWQERCLDGVEQGIVRGTGTHACSAY